MVKELNLDDEWLLHKLCKVYLLISSQRIVGCLVAEPIRYGYKVISNYPSIINSSSSSAKENFKTKTGVLLFGNVSFERETIQRSNVKNSEKIADEFIGTAILCETEPVSAVSGISAIWVLASSRRKGIATRLLDIAREWMFQEGCSAYDQYLLDPFLN
ncbi:protein CHROMOSOME TRANSMISSION FIDELITY 7 isoform X2 [Amborella trichopoda]|uniref:protein CHROMOSOME TRANSMISSION FIDELITY 7 isoform X2 n=1 Tax=Amborella trichopoda TaxID=13333 RepID=UPI0005D34D2F|nr:protein CHROMOSOME TRANSMISSION FIDELITY 7 isoform X2 [Amborella trichopoda]|eukprot:XP_011627181.1 protein CHROMOSOME TRANSMISSION FIDELITY 7 isoform X2 [Amborella trichopoda]